METRPACSFCGKDTGPFEHAAYQSGQSADEVRFLGWLCQGCARQHGSHARFAALMLALDPTACFVMQPGTPREAHYRIGSR